MSSKVVPFLTLVVLGAGVAACGGSSTGAAGKSDATAACTVLARSTNQPAQLTLPVGDRLGGAALLGLAAAGEDANGYGNLAAPMKDIQVDISTDRLNAVTGHVKAALASCQADKLPH